MIQWKQRLYAFLLRRILGPLLDEASHQKLHESIEVSLQEGRFVLKQIGLSTAYISQRAKGKLPSLRIRKATINRLEICLSLQEHSDAPRRSSLAWRAMSLGGSEDSVSLVAQVEVDGIFLEVEPNLDGPIVVEPIMPTTSDAETGASKSYLSSYIDAALSSLRLTVQLKNLQIRLCSPDETKEKWIELRLQSASYHDVEVSPSGSSEATYETVMHKAVDFGRVIVAAGESSLIETEEKTVPVSTKIALLDGTSQVRLRVVEYKSQQTRVNAPRRVQQDLEVTLNHRLQLFVDEASLIRVQSLVRRYKDISASLEPVTTPTETCEQRDEVQDQADLETIEGIMKAQYQEARLLAERNEVRGGILIPDDSGDDVTFDAFFDANDKSFSHYSTVLRESIILAGGDEDVADFVHTKVKFHLMEGSMKVSFWKPALNTEASPNPRLEEYMLLTFSDLNLSSTLSLRTSEYSLSISHLDIEDSQLEHIFEEVAALKARKVEIGSVLSFTPGSGGRADGSDLLLQAPCVSVHAKTERSESESVEVEVAFEPLQLMYRHDTLSNLSSLLSSVGSRTREPAGDVLEAEGEGRELYIHVSCPSLTVVIPTLVERDWKSLYERCGVSCENSFATKSSLGLLVDDLSLEIAKKEPSCSHSVSASSRNLFVFATTPGNQQSLLDKSVRRFDILAVLGRAEVNPYIPVAVKFYRNQKEESENSGSKAFPVVPSISSFKARQEDEDDDNRIDRVLSSKLEDLNLGTRKDLRGNDPQSAMLNDASKSDFVLEIHIPALIGDLSTKELSVLADMIHCITPRDRREGTPETVSSQPPAKRNAVSCVCDRVSFTVHGSPSMTNAEQVESPFYYMIKLDQLKSHLLFDNRVMRHVRLLSHEVDFFEIADLEQTELVRRPSLGPEDRRDRMRERSTSGEASRTTPILYRSRLFSPISRHSPSILIDIINPNVAASQDIDKLVHKNVHVTLYDMTYRYDFDSGWMERLKSIVKSQKDQLQEEEEEEAIPRAKDRTAAQTMTRLFFFIADCNIDYLSSPRFKTASRVIGRFGDFRISSNIMWPIAPVQAFSISLGDAALYLCNRRFPYNFENTRLLDSSALMKAEQTSLDQLSLTAASTGDSVLEAMNYRTILMLDSVDAVVALSNVKPKSPSDPYVRASLTFGELSIFACKDSFVHFLNTIGDLTMELTALDDDAFQSLKLKDSANAASGTGSMFDSGSREAQGEGSSEAESEFRKLDDLRKRSALRPSPGSSSSQRQDSFLLDGYDWTAIDQVESTMCGIAPGEEQAARWYGTTELEQGIDTEEIGLLAGHSSLDAAGFRSQSQSGPRIVPHHFPIQPVSDPLDDGDMGAAKYAETEAIPQVQNRVIVHDLAIKLRFFDGYDWPELLDEQSRSLPRTGPFVIDEQAVQYEKEKEKVTKDVEAKFASSKKEELERKAKLMGDLLASDRNVTFQDVPLPEERGARLKEQAEMRRLSRRSNKYFQASASGVSLRVDSMQETSDHNLVSILNLKAQDSFLAETVSQSNPRKMVGEWFNEVDHPRDSRDGLLMMKMITWHPTTRVTPENRIANDECQAVLTILPLRCNIDQRAIRFAGAFFRADGNDEDDADDSLPRGLHPVPPPLFRRFVVKPCKMKIDYAPQKIDTKALKDGAFVELINLSPLEGLVLNLQKVKIEDVVGFGGVLSILVRSWISDICATQIVKFVTNAKPFAPFTNVAGGAADLVVLPWDALKNGERVQKAIRAGVKSFTNALTLETLTTTSRVTEFVADGVSRLSSPGSDGRMLPSRPLQTPRNVTDTAPHAVESVARGLQEANYKIVIIPYREYHRTGARGAARSIMKGIPVAIAAPASGAAEAVSFALLGARNQLRPDVRKEEESSQRGLHLDG